MKKRFTFCLLALFCAAAFISICTGTEVPEKDRIYIITRLTGRLISEQHYSQHPLNEVKSAMIFDEYFKMLDPNRMFFTEKDIQEFLPRRANLHKELARGDSSFAYVVFEKFLKRFHEYCAFAEKELKKKAEELGANDGVWVAEIVDNGSASGILEVDDVIIGINGKRVKNFAGLQEELAKHRPGDKVKVKVLRDKKEKTVATKVQKSGLEKYETENVKILKKYGKI